MKKVVKIKISREQSIDRILDAFIGHRIKEVRKLINLSQGEMAAKLRLTSQQALSRYERGQNSVPAQTLYKLSELAQISMDCFFPVTGQKDINLDV